jgi:uncharacterized membrane protein
MNRWTAASAAGVVALCVAVALVAHPPAGLPQPARVALFGLCWPLFAACAGLVRRVPRRAAVVLILAGGIALPLLAAFAPPSSSDDVYRYVWDGRVQAAGIDPYRYAPADPHLAHLRDPVLWPVRSTWCVPEGATDPATGQPLTAGCTLINRPTVHTIYPPVAQAYFVTVHLLGGDDGYLPPQLGAVLLAAGVTLLLLLVLPRFSTDPRRAALWAWCPLVALEAGSNAHVDVLAVLLAAGALAALARRRAGTGGVLLGLAIATKLTPALLVPAVLRRRPVALLAAVAGAVVAVYLPHVATVGVGVLGYVPGYLSEEGYTDGSRFALLTLVLPHAVAAPVAVAALTAVALAVARRADPDRPWAAATVLTGAALLVATPTYPWYAMLLVMLVAMGGRAEWLTVALAGYVAFHAHDVHFAFTPAHRLGYGAALAVVLLAAAWRYRSSWAQRGGGQLGDAGLERHGGAETQLAPGAGR